MADRVYLPGQWQSGDLLRLPESEAQHVGRVLRMKTGELIEVFDGTGTAAIAEIAAVGKREVSVRIRDLLEPEPPVSVELTVAVCPPKGDRFRWLIEKLSELGVARIIPLKTARSIVDPRESRLEKLESVMVAACKQCRRSRIPQLESVTSLEDLLVGELPAVRAFGSLSGIPWGLYRPDRHPAGAEPFHALLCIGPEGGWTPAEEARLESQGCVGIRLPGPVLRIETAALALAVLILHSTGVAVKSENPATDSNCK